MEKDLATRIQRVHAVFCDATGAQLRLGLGEYSREREWAEWLKLGFTESDIVTVATYLRKKIREGSRNPGALRFSNLISRPEIFEETLQMAHAEGRIKQPSTRDKAIQQLRPTAAPVSPEQSKPTARPIADYISDLRKAAGGK